LPFVEQTIELKPTGV